MTNLRSLCTENVLKYWIDIPVFEETPCLSLS